MLTENKNRYLVNYLWGCCFMIVIIIQGDGHLEPVKSTSHKYI